MSKSDDEKAALQLDSGGAGLPSLAGGAGGGIRVPGDFIDKLTTTVTPEGLSAQGFKDYQSGTGEFGSDYGGGFSQTTTTSGGTAGVPLELVVTGKRMPSMSDRFGPGGLTTLTGGDFSVGPDFGSLGIGMGDMGGLDPTTPSFKPQKQDGFLKRLIKGYARINPQTAPFMMLKDLKDAYDESDGPADFGKNFLKKYAAQAATNKLGLSPLATQGLRTAQAAYKGDITPGQGFASMGTSALFNKGLPSIYKDAYMSGGMNQVYLTAALAQQAQRAAQKRILQPGPGGDG